MFAHSNWYFEVQSTLLVWRKKTIGFFSKIAKMYALLKRKLAHENLIKCPEQQFDQLCIEPSDRLREAAGVFNFIYDSVCVKFVVDPAVYHYPESYAISFKILAKYVFSVKTFFLL